MFEKDIYLSFDGNISKYMTIKERLFGIDEIRLRLYLHMLFWRTWYLRFDDSYISWSNKNDSSRYMTVSDLYEQYKGLKNAYWLYSNVKHKVNYNRVLLEEFSKVCIDVLTMDENERISSYIHKDRIYIRRSFADYLKKHVNKLCELDNPLFCEMKVKLFLTSFYDAFKKEIDNELQQGVYRFNNDNFNAILDEEYNRAIDVYTDFFLNIYND